MWGDGVNPIFPKWTNKIPLYVAIVVPVLSLLLIAFVWYYFSPNFLAVGYQPEQPVPFSHQLHAGELGLDCRYCHSTVNEAAFAAIPSTATCMGCHNKVLPQSSLLAPIRESFATHQPIPWVHIHVLPSHAHFNHSAHVNVGVGCVSCHGRVDTMEKVYQVEPLSMSWCLECHRDPGPHLRPPGEVTNMIYDPVEAGYTPDLNPKFHEGLIQPPEACGACHY